MASSTHDARLHARLVTHCPVLLPDDYVRASPRTFSYNCFAWAAGDDTRSWYPGGDPEVSYWPAGGGCDLTLTSVIAALGTLGFAPCSHGVVDPACVKVALYVDGDGDVVHAARQLASGRWTSKMGTWEDLEHATPECLAGGTYGAVAAYLARPRSPGDP